MLMKQVPFSSLIPIRAQQAATASLRPTQLSFTHRILFEWEITMCLAEMKTRCFPGSPADGWPGDTVLPLTDMQMQKESLQKGDRRGWLISCSPSSLRRTQMSRCLSITHL